MIKQIFLFVLLSNSESFVPIKKFFRNTKIFSNELNSIECDEFFYKKEYLKYLEDFKLIDDSCELRCNDSILNELINERKENFEIFKKNFKKIQEYNSNNNSSFDLGLNEFADSYENNHYNDLMKKKIGLFDVFKNDLISVKQIIENPRYYLEKYKYIPDELVWNSSIVSDVKNQGRCGSCWAFSSTGAIESNMRINNHTISRLSEQELVDCSFENSGCMGGLMHLAFDYVIENDGLTSDELYPYNATRRRCKFNYNTTTEITNKTTNKHNCTKEECTCDGCSVDESECNEDNLSSIHKINGSNIQDYKFMIPRSVVDIKASLKGGPISIALDASPFEFRFYRTGIIDLLPTNTSRLNHAVLLVGYETNINGSYWIIQNSWGENWGDNGYAKIKIENGDGVLLSQLYGVFPYN